MPAPPVSVSLPAAAVERAPGRSRRQRVREGRAGRGREAADEVSLPSPDAVPAPRSTVTPPAAPEYETELPPAPPLSRTLLPASPWSTFPEIPGGGDVLEAAQRVGAAVAVARGGARAEVDVDRRRGAAVVRGVRARAAAESIGAGVAGDGVVPVAAADRVVARVAGEDSLPASPLIVSLSPAPLIVSLPPPPASVFCCASPLIESDWGEPVTFWIELTPPLRRSSSCRRPPAVCRARSGRARCCSCRRRSRGCWCRRRRRRCRRRR